MVDLTANGDPGTHGVTSAYSAGSSLCWPGAVPGISLREAKVD